MTGRGHRRAGKPARFRRTSTAQVLGEQYVFARWAAGWDGGLRLTISMTAFEQGLRAGREGAGWIREPEQRPCCTTPRTCTEAEKIVAAIGQASFFYFAFSNLI